MSNMYGKIIFLVLVLSLIVLIFWRSEQPVLTDPRKKLGNATWTLLHAIADRSSSDGLARIPQWIEDLSEIYPCLECRAHMKQYLRDHPVNNSSGGALIKWMFDFHNSVNEKLGKPKMTPAEYTFSSIRITSCPTCQSGIPE